MYGEQANKSAMNLAMPSRAPSENTSTDGRPIPWRAGAACSNGQEEGDEDRTVSCAVLRTCDSTVSVQRTFKKREGACRDSMLLYSSEYAITIVYVMIITR